MMESPLSPSLTDQMVDRSADPRFTAAPMMLARSFFAQNVATGCAFGGFAVSVLALEARYQSSRAMAEMVLAVLMLTMGLVAPLVAGMIVRIGVRMTMTIGVVLSAFGYLALAFAPSMLSALCIAALLIGPGAGLFGSIPSSILAGGWYPDARGRALGIANIPLFIALVPLLGLLVIERFGLSSFFLCLAGLHVLLLPFMIGIKDPPVEPEAPDDQANPEEARLHPLRPILANPLFWLIVVGVGFLYANNVTNSAHIIPIAVEGGTSPAAAAVLLSVGGGAAIFGSILAGFLCDRAGAARTLALAALVSALSWAIIASSGWFPALVIAMLLSGICGPAVFPPANVLATQIFGVRALPRVLGLLGLFGLPFTFAMSPAAGWARDVAGSYSIVITVCTILCVLVCIEFFLIGRALDRTTSKEF